MISKIEVSDVARETMFVLSYFDPSFVAKIPDHVLNELKEIAKKSNIPVKIDKNKKLNEQDVLDGTKELISLIYYSYIATEEEKRKLQDTWRANELLYQQELREKYNPDNLFKKKGIQEEKIEQENVEKNMALIKYRESNSFKIIINKIMTFFKLK